VALSELEGRLARALADGRLDGEALKRTAAEFGTKQTQALVARAGTLASAVHDRNAS
jgi:hypothetical protein